MSPYAEQDSSPRGLPKGAEKTQQDFIQATGGQKPVVSPSFLGKEPVAPTTPPAPDEGEPSGGDLRPTDMEIPGLGNLGDFLFANTDRPDESIHAEPGPEPQFLDTPAGPSNLYLQMLHDPGVSATTKSLIDLVSRVRMLMPVSQEIPTLPHSNEPPMPRT